MIDFVLEQNKAEASFVQRQRRAYPDRRTSLEISGRPPPGRVGRPSVVVEEEKDDGNDDEKEAENSSSSGGEVYDIGLAIELDHDSNSNNHQNNNNGTTNSNNNNNNNDNNQDDEMAELYC